MNSSQNIRPLLSIVVTSRNDNHGGDALKRTQIFTSAFLEQCKRHALNAELIFVDWNPPGDKPPLKEVLRWTVTETPCQVKFIQVPAEIHNTLKHSKNLPLYQMIAKNVGIRRAKGQFILCTNIDIVFNNELMSFIAAGGLNENCFYRIDRHDIRSNIPDNQSLNEQLDYCAQNILRVNAKTGTFNWGEEAIDKSKIKIEKIPAKLVAKEATVPPLPSNFIWILRNVWFKYRQARPSQLSKSLTKLVPKHWKTVLFNEQFLYYISMYWTKIFQSRSIKEYIAEIIHFSWVIYHFTVPDTFRKILSTCIPRPIKQFLLGPDICPELGYPYRMADLHTNACGDFTLLSKTMWEKIRGYPEFDMYSWHIDSIGCHAAHHAGAEQVILKDPMRIYHIEHSDGWTPGGEKILFRKLKSKGIPYLSYLDLQKIAHEMQAQGKVTVFNDDNWGFGNLNFAEYTANSNCESFEKQ